MHEIASAESSLRRRGARSRQVAPASQLCLFRDWLPRVEEARKGLEPEPRTDLMRDVLRLLRRAARSSQPAPTNVVLAELLGVPRQSSARAVRGLEKDGHLRMEKISPSGRRFRFPDGSATEVGEFREGHAPGPKGRARPPRVRAPNSPPLRVAVRPIAFDVLRPPETCQYPMWEDDERPRERSQDRFCGKAVARGESWCLHHLAKVSPRRAQKLAREPAAPLTCS